MSRRLRRVCVSIASLPLNVHSLVRFSLVAGLAGRLDGYGASDFPGRGNGLHCCGFDGAATG